MAACKALCRANAPRALSKIKPEPHPPALKPHCLRKNTLAQRQRGAQPLTTACPPPEKHGCHAHAGCGLMTVGWAGAALANPQTQARPGQAKPGKARHGNCKEEPAGLALHHGALRGCSHTHRKRRISGTFTPRMTS